MSKPRMKNWQWQSITAKAIETQTEVRSVTIKDGQLVFFLMTPAPAFEEWALRTFHNARIEHYERPSRPRSR